MNEDALMDRTAGRPLVRGWLTVREALRLALLAGGRAR